MNIVTASNDQYAQHLGVMLTSLLENMKDRSMLAIHIIDGNISYRNKLKLKRIVRKYHLKVQFIKIDKKMFDSFRGHSRISKETYYRIVIPNILCTNISKALYLDCDLIVKADISKLWNVNIENHFLAAVESPIYQKRVKDLSLPSQASYFNAGVLLINLNKWREDNTTQKVIHYIENNPEKIKLMDQDALNAILYDKWLKLSYKWNYTMVHWKKINKFPMKKPAILHFTGSRKPWNSSNHRFKGEYDRYLKNSLWEV